MSKLLPLSAAALLAAAGTVSARTATAIPGDRFSSQEQTSRTGVKFGSITADTGSAIEIDDNRRGQQGALLTTKALRDGVEVDVSIGASRISNVPAAATVDGQIVGQRVIHPVR